MHSKKICAESSLVRTQNHIMLFFLEFLENIDYND